MINLENNDGYHALSDVLARAYEQAAKGKGAVRHADGRPFTEQPMQTISELLGTHEGLLYQAMKKIQESNRMDKDAAIRELLGAINYLAGAIIFLERKVSRTNNTTAKHIGDPCFSTTTKSQNA